MGLDRPRHLADLGQLVLALVHLEAVLVQGNESDAVATTGGVQERPEFCTEVGALEGATAPKPGGTEIRRAYRRHRCRGQFEMCWHSRYPTL
jgi:hypothetical protein